MLRIARRRGEAAVGGVRAERCDLGVSGKAIVRENDGNDSKMTVCISKG